MCPRTRTPLKLLLEAVVHASITLYTPSHFTLFSESLFIKNRHEALEVCRLKQCDMYKCMVSSFSSCHLTYSMHL